MSKYKKNRRLAILCHPGAGGSGVVATELAVLLAELGHQIHLVGERKPFRLGSINYPLGRDNGYRDLGEDPPAKSFWGQLMWPAVAYGDLYLGRRRKRYRREVSIFMRY